MRDWAFAAMTVFSVHHTTTYRYKKPVMPGRHQMLFRPRDSFDQRLLDSCLTVTPDPAEVRWIHDVFGNCVTLVDFAERTRVLKFESVIRLEHTPENTPDFRIEDYARSHPFAYAEDELPDLAAYIRRHHPGSGVEDWLAKFVTTDVSRPTGQLLMTLNEAIAEGDRDGPVRLGGGSTHAWCQIYVPGSGWVEFDPTNGIVGNRDLIRVGVARTPEQAIPLSGSYWGDAEEELGMEVTVNVKTEGGSPSLSAVDAK